MAEEIACSFAAEALKGLSSQTWREIQYIFNYNNNLKNLMEKVKCLEGKDEAIKLQVDAAKRNAEIIGPDVLQWLEKVDNIKNEANEVLERTKNAFWGCLFCKCPKLHSRYELSKEALMKTTEIIELHNESNFGRIGYPAPPGQMPWTTSQEFDGFESRMKIKNDVMEALKDDSITRIGICGMAGIGKTTLVKEIADKVKAANLFDEVTMAVVSNNPSVSNIQDQLAENLGLKIEEKTDRGRAERLYRRLMNNKKRILIILDDVWQEINVQDIGIHALDGIKVLLTSRYRGVCEKMNARPFEVEVLSHFESWHLFTKIAEFSNKANNLKDIAREVIKECGGLPLAIVIVAKALKNKEEYAWREALAELKEASVKRSILDMDNLVNSRINLSYKYLAEHSKLLLLLCSIFPEDYNIPLEGLVRYAKGQDLFKNLTIARTRDIVYCITEELKSCYLLLVGDKECVKLHDVVRDFCLSIASSDVVRDVCLSIASSDEHVHMVRHVGLKEWPQEDSYTHYTAISLTFEEIDELPSGFECPKLHLLRLKFQEDKVRIPENFFKGMNELRVLELKLNGELGSSLQSLVNLRTLSLDSCRLYSGILVIESLGQLEVLSFYNSCLDCFPEGIEQLRNLKSLDLRFDKGPPLPSGVLLQLKKLEELYLGSYYEDWKKNKKEAYFGVITEINSLQNLQTIHFFAYDDYCLQQVLENLHLEKLTRFKITRLNYPLGNIDFQFRKVLTLVSINVDLLLNRTVKTLLCKTEDLTLSVKGLRNMVNQLDDIEFINLKKLTMQDCDLKYLIDATSFLASVGAFVNLEELVIRNAKNLEELCHGNIPLGSFVRLREVRLYDVPALRHLWGEIQHPCLRNLRNLHIESCGPLRSLFLQSSLKCLRELQVISIRKCPMLETLVSGDEEDEKNIRDIEFSQVEVLNLKKLASFRSLGPELGQETLFKKVMLPNLKMLIIDRVDGIRCIVDDQVSIGSLSKLRTMEVYGCHGLEVVFDVTGLNIEGDNIQSLLGQLESMELTYLPNLKHIWRMLPEGIQAFKNLSSLKVGFLEKMRYLLSPSAAKMLVALETLEINFCQQMEALMGKEERPILEIEYEEDSVKGRHGETSIEKIVFQKLRSIEVATLQNFQMFCSENIDLELPSFTILKIVECHRFDLCHDISKKASPSEIHAFRNLRSLDVWRCDNLRYLLSPSMSNMLVGLETLQIQSCQAMEAMIGRDKSVISEIEYVEDKVKIKDGEENANKIQFPKLRRLEFVMLKNFRMLCSENIDLELPSLTELVIHDCPMMAKFCVGRLCATSLHIVQVKQYRPHDNKFLEKNVVLAAFSSWLKDCDSRIRCLECSIFGKGRCEHFLVKNYDALPRQTISTSTTMKILSRQHSF